MLTLALMASPIVFFGFTWAVVFLVRGFFPERTAPLDAVYLQIPDGVDGAGATVYVGVHQIAHYAEDRRASQPVRYRYRPGRASGMPSLWMKDVWCRRN